MKIENRSRKRSIKLDEIRIWRIRTLSFLSSTFTTPSLMIQRKLDCRSRKQKRKNQPITRPRCEHSDWFILRPSGLSIRAVTHNTCYCWVCLIFPWCYWWNCLLLKQLRQNVTSLLRVWRTRLQVTRKQITAPAWHSPIISEGVIRGIVIHFRWFDFSLRASEYELIV